MGSGARLDVLGRIFQARQAAGVAELLSQGAGKLREYTQALRESGGVAARIAGVQLNTLRGDAVVLKSALEGLAIAVGEALAGPLRAVASVAAKVVSAIARWVRENRDLVIMAGTAAVAIGAVGTALAADDLGRAVDVLTKAMTTANTDLNQLGDAMKYIGPIAKSAGIAFEEVIAAIQLLSNAGIQGEMAGTTLCGALLALTSPSKEAADRLKSLGVSVLDAQGGVRPLADIIEDLNRAMRGMGAGTLHPR